MSNPLICERCGGDLETDDAISIIEGVCCICRRKRMTPPTAARQPGAPVRPRPPRPQASNPPAFPRPILPRGLQAEHITVRSTVHPSPAAQDFGPSVRVRRRRRDLVIGVTVGFVVTLGMTGYVLTKKKESPSLPISKTKNVDEYPIHLTIKPANAIVTLDDKEVGPADPSGRLTIAMSGRGEDVHWLEVKANGFHSVRRPLSIYSGVNEFAVELVAKPYDVAIRTTPDNAEIWINDQLKGYSPLTLTLLPWERARLAVKRAGYQEVSRELAPPTRGEKLELDLPLSPAGVFVQIETDPPGAIISIDGASRGVTPLTAELPPSYLGRPVKIAARKEGYEEAWLQTTLPATPTAGPVTARLALAPSHGTAVPSTSTVASLASPPRAAATKQAVQTEASGSKTAFVLLSPTAAGVGHTILLEQVVDQIHRLADTQQFVVLTCTADGLESWPGGLEVAKATSDQKIRAYDKVRSVRPTGRGSVDQALASALQFKPDSIRLFASETLSQKELSSFAELVKGRPVAVHIVQSEAGPDDDWLQSFVSAQKGSLTVLGLAGTPAVAQKGDASD